MELQDLPGVGPVLAGRLTAAGFDTVAAVAAATPEDLVGVPGVGSATAGRLIEAAGSVGVEPAASPAAESAVAKAVHRLQRAVPDLAASKKHAKALQASVGRMAALVGDIDRKKVRRRIIDEARRVSSEAKKRATSNKAAKALKGHAARIEKAVRKLD